MSKDKQANLFYEDIFDAIAKTVNGNPKGLNIKQIAMDLWPSRNPDTARSAFSRAINPENHDVNLNPEEMVKSMEITACPEHIIYYLCDKFRFKRPEKLEERDIQRTIETGMSSIEATFKALQREIESLKKIKDTKSF